MAAIVKGATLQFKVGTTIVSVTGSAQSTDWNMGGSFEGYLGADSEFNAAAGWGKFQTLDFKMYATADTILPTQYSYSTVNSTDILAVNITGSNWIFQDANYANTNKAPGEVTLKYWRAPGVTT